jgi:hypothetical protein
VGFTSPGPDGSVAATAEVEPDDTTASEGFVTNRVEVVSGALLCVEDWVALNPTVTVALGAKAAPQSAPVRVYP